MCWDPGKVTTALKRDENASMFVFPLCCLVTPLFGAPHWGQASYLLCRLLHIPKKGHPYALSRKDSFSEFGSQIGQL